MKYNKTVTENGVEVLTPTDKTENFFNNLSPMEQVIFVETEKLCYANERKQHHKTRRPHSKPHKRNLIAQKLSGLVLVVCGILLSLINEDTTPLLFFVPLGLFLMVTRQRIITK